MRRHTEFDGAEQPPLEERLRQTEYGGTFGINQAILELPIDRLSNGVPVKDVIAECEALFARPGRSSTTVTRKRINGTGLLSVGRLKIFVTASSKKHGAGALALSMHCLTISWPSGARSSGAAAHRIYAKSAGWGAASGV